MTYQVETTLRRTALGDISALVIRTHTTTHESDVLLSDGTWHPMGDIRCCVFTLPDGWAAPTKVLNGRTIKRVVYETVKESDL